MKTTIAMMFLLVSSHVIASDQEWDIQDGQEYGYKMDGTHRILMVRYLGEKDGVHQVGEEVSRTQSTIYECKIPCEYLTFYNYKNSKIVKRTIYEVTEGQVAYDIFKDISNGHLSVYTTDKGTLWLDHSLGFVWSNGNH